MGLANMLLKNGATVTTSAADVIEALAPLDERAIAAPKGQLPLFEPEEAMALLEQLRQMMENMQVTQGPGQGQAGGEGQVVTTVAGTRHVPVEHHRQPSVGVQYHVVRAEVVVADDGTRPACRPGPHGLRARGGPTLRRADRRGCAARV